MTPEDREWIREFRSGKHIYITQAQWGYLSEILTSSTDLVFRLDAPLGFEFVMYVYEDAPCPGVPPSSLIWVYQKYLPGKLDKDQTWELLTQWTHSARNEQKLKYYNLPTPKAREHYDY
jgi:hypothetical protein